VSISQVGHDRSDTLSASLEDYLEAVLALDRAGQPARVRDIAKHLGVGMPSVSIALRALSDRGMVKYDPYRAITLTHEGRKRSRQVQHRHEVLQKFLENVLGVDAQEARDNACRMEHAIDNKVLERLMHFSQFIQMCPRTGGAWREALKARNPRPKLPDDCQECLQRSEQAGEECRP
jgi:DtxR family Mn-dependent transcriptional regulator